MELTTIDHFVLGINNLEKGIQEFEEKSGIKPVFGGVHEKVGTHNALVSLGEGKYLEILAPLDPSKSAQSLFGDLNKDQTYSSGLGHWNYKFVKYSYYFRRSRY